MGQALKIARFDLGTSIRTKKAFIGIIVYIGLALLVAAIWSFIQNKITGEPGVTDQLQGSKDQIMDAVTQKLGYDKALVGHLAQIPFALMTFFWMTQSFLPVVIAVMSSDILNREIRSRAARFVLLRSSRTSLVIGKSLSHGLLLVIAAVLSWAVFVTYITFKLNGFDLAVGLPHALTYLGFTLAVGFCYLGLTALVSSLVDGSGVTLLVTIVALIVLGVIGSSDTIGWISPSFYRYRIWSPHTLVMLSGIAAYIGFGLAFFAGAWQRTVRRDV